MVESQFVGCIVGLAVGDALGYPAEFRTRAQLLREIGPEGITDFVALRDPRFSRPIFVGPHHPPGTYTDDTQMTIAVAEGMLAAGRRDHDELMAEIGRRFVEWADSEDNNRAPGDTCVQGCENLARGTAWHAAGVADSKGCGSTMRVAPIGLFYGSLDRVAEVARFSSLLTHGHPAALEGAAAAALMVAMALQGAEPREVFDEIDRRCSPVCPDFAVAWKKVPSLIAEPPERVLTKGCLGEGWIAEEAVASAMYCFWRHPDSFERAVLEAINTDGDSDSIGTIAGSVLGARLGAEAIPERWRRSVENAEYLHSLGRRLYESVHPSR